MEIREIIELHGRSKKQINLGYVRPSGRHGHCFIDPTKPLRWKNTETSYPSSGTPDMMYLNANKDTCLVSVFKNPNKAEIFVKPCNLYFQNVKRGAVSKVLYGEKA